MKWAVLPVIGGLITTVFVGRIVTSIVQPTSYKIYFVGPFDDTSGEKDSTTQIWNALDSGGELPPLDGVPVALHRRSDFGDEETARRLAAELARKPDTLMVVGHVWSSQTRAALPAYMEDASPPIPVILTTETNPNLLPPVRDGDDRYFPVYRLSPTDDSQARLAAESAKRLKARAIWVVEDGANRVYSEYLARQFIKHVEQDGAGRVVHWSVGAQDTTQGVIERFRVDFIFYIGGWENGLVLVRQVRMLPARTKRPDIIFSDNAMDDRLWSYGQHDAEGSRIIFPIALEEYKSSRYGVYGRDAHALIKKLIEHANRDYDDLARADRVIQRTFNWALGLKRAGDARNAICKYMERAAKRGVSFPLGQARFIQFGMSGIPLNRSFDLWNVCREGHSCATEVRPRKPQFTVVSSTLLAENHGMAPH